MMLSVWKSVRTTALVWLINYCLIEEKTKAKLMKILLPVRTRLQCIENKKLRNNIWRWLDYVFGYLPFSERVEDLVWSTLFQRNPMNYSGRRKYNRRVIANTKLVYYGLPLYNIIQDTKRDLTILLQTEQEIDNQMIVYSFSFVLRYLLWWIQFVADKYKKT